MLNVVIVEDEDEAAVLLGSFLERYAQEKGLEMRSVRYKCTTDFLSGYTGADIVFMDINIMNDMDGIKAAHKLRDTDSVVTLIFITSFEQFAVKGYEVEAYDFIVKPVSYPDFSLRMNRVLRHLQKEQLDVIHIRTEGKVAIVSVRDIRYVEVIRHKLLFHTTGGVIESNGTLHETESALTEKFFVRCSKCYLVNLRYVRGVEGTSVNVDGEVLFVSRARKKEFLSALNRYLSK